MEQNILIICTGNSARSQMAEAFFSKFHGDKFTVFSAGTRPAETLFPPVVEVMKEKGIDLSSNKPKHIKQFLGHKHFRYVIIVCSDADKECPTIMGSAERLFWPFPDPAAVEGSEEQIILETRKIRDQIEAKVKHFEF